MITPALQRVSTGIAGLDEVLHGGYFERRTYLLTGPPGGGKTTIGWHFLTAGARHGEPVLFITFGESQDELVENARCLGFETEGVSFCDLSPTADSFAQIQHYDIFPASEVELAPTTETIIAAVEAVKPKRVFIDSMTALRYLSKDGPEFSRQTLSFLRYIQERGGCVVMTSEASPGTPDDDLRFLCDGVIQLTPSQRARTLLVRKFRGSDYRLGEHTLRLTSDGATVYPRLIPEEHGEAFVASPLSWGVPQLDALTHGGIERGTVTLVTGPSGVGKTTIGMQFLKEAARRGERSAIYTFDERVSTLMQRCQAVNIPVDEMVQRGTLSVVAVEALRYSPDEFANTVRNDVERSHTKIVMIDSISGYKLSVSGDDLVERLHALCRYLQNVGVTVLLVNELLNLQEFRVSEVGISYLADNVIMLRYMESQRDGRAEMGRAIGVLKKRLSDFEKSLRPFELVSTGLQIGEPTRHLADILRPSLNHDSVSL